MGEALDRLIALSGTEHVSGYTRTSSTGKAVSVSAYTRSPGDMQDGELIEAFRKLRGKTDPQSRNKAAAVVSEIRKRGISDHEKEADARDREDREDEADDRLHRSIADLHAAARKPEPKKKRGLFNRK